MKFSYVGHSASKVLRLNEDQRRDCLSNAKPVIVMAPASVLFKDQEG